MRWELKNNLILIGYMGCGKSSVGHQLSDFFSAPFLDTDQLIEKKEGCSIKEIFSRQGEEAFREMETECLKELLNQRIQGTIISVGGGLPLREENRKLLNRLGQVIYLKATPKTLFERLKGDTARPLLQVEDPQKHIQNMLEKREEFYQDAARMVIQVDGKSFGQIVKEISRIEEKENENSGD